jgi:hypothetical protein
LKYRWRIRYRHYSDSNGLIFEGPLYVDAANSRRARNLAIHQLMKLDGPVAIKSVTAIGPGTCEWLA